MWTLTLLAFCFLIFTPITSELIPVFIGHEDPRVSYHDQRIKLEGQNSHHLTDVSICLRFYNFYIEQVFLMTHLHPDTLEAYMDWSRDGVKVLLFQRLNGQFIQPHRQENTKRLAPRLWHGYCFTYNHRLGARKVYIDGEKVLEDIIDNEAEKDIPPNFVDGIGFLSRTDNPEWNMMTDINIWNVTLADEDVKDWTDCTEEEQLENNKIIDWSSANWTTKGIRNDLVNRSTVCYKRQGTNKIFKFPFSRSYLDSVDFCHLLNGKLAIAINNTTAMEMLKKCDSHFSGFNDIENEGNFINPYTGEAVADARWAYHEPNNFGVGEDCTDTSKNGLFNDISCSSKQCTLCNLATRPQFELRGLCDSARFGTKYYLDVKDTFAGVYDIQGWRGSTFIWNQVNLTWEIIEAKNKNIIAFTNDTSGEYPFGVHR